MSWRHESRRIGAIVWQDFTAERRTKARTERDLLSGPGKIAQAIGVDGSFSGEDMLARGARFHVRRFSSLGGRAPWRLAPATGM